MDILSDSALKKCLTGVTLLIASGLAYSNTPCSEKCLDQSTKSCNPTNDKCTYGGWGTLTCAQFCDQ